MDIAALDVWVVNPVAKVADIHENRGVTKWSDREKKSPPTLCERLLMDNCDTPGHRGSEIWKPCDQPTPRPPGVVGVVGWCLAKSYPPSFKIRQSYPPTSEGSVQSPG